MPIYQNLSDNELVSFLRDGDAAAYTEIYDRYFELMFVFAYKKLQDEELAKDFVQDLFTKLWANAQDLKLEGNLAQYLYISLRSRIVDYFAHLKVQAKYVDFLAGFSEGRMVAQTDHLIRQKQLAAYIDMQIAQLPAKMREVFELSRKEHLSNREIAQRLGTSESSVSQHINGAVKILKTKINFFLLLFFF